MKTIIEKNTTPLLLHYDAESPYGNENTSTVKNITNEDGWERWSLPIGNGYFGANVFGRTETERIQITEKTMSNPYYRTNPNTGKDVSLGGLNNFSETYIDIGHSYDKVQNYRRWLDLQTAVTGVSYDYEGVTYSREVFASYPDKALVIFLTSSKENALSFTLRPTIPWKQEYASWEGDRASKTGQVLSWMSGEDGIIELSGKMGYFDIDYMGLYKVVADSGNVFSATCINDDGDIDGTITVINATSAYIYVTLGTDYELCKEVFTTSVDAEKPTFGTDLNYTREKISRDFEAIAKQLKDKKFQEAYATLKHNHLEDYEKLFGRVSLDLGNIEDCELTTDKLIKKYQAGTYSNYLEMLYFQYGRYLLIASSRKGTLPANLQGAWNRYNKSPWGSGLWHNINVQMNYWPAFSTNIAETFEAYVGYNRAYMPAAEQNASDMIAKYNLTQFGKDGGNGWCIETGAFPYQIKGDRSAGNLGFTTQLFWEYYNYTQDKTILREIVFPLLVSAARYIVKSVEQDSCGKYLVSHCDSPEMFVNRVWYYTKGTTYAQSFAYLNNYHALLAAKELGIDLADEGVLNSNEFCVFKSVMEQIDKYDPINIGLSGQVKEFREEDYYCSVGDEPFHRHVSHLIGLYPGDIINSNTPAWMDAAHVTLDKRGDKCGGWGWAMAHRSLLWSRIKEGERAYALFNRLIYTNAATNLWNVNNPYQIDGNLGGTAAVSEMLLQSHEGYIEPLAAIPETWSNGSYTGLVARGNFEVSAMWKNGVATIFNIKSKKGGTVFVRYEGIDKAKVIRLSDGKKIDYNVSRMNLINFETTINEVYIITGFNVVKKIGTPKKFELEKINSNQYKLLWDTVNEANVYRVYMAIENQPDYELVLETDRSEMYYESRNERINARITFKVVAVNSEGVEGKGLFVFLNNGEDNCA